MHKDTWRHHGGNLKQPQPSTWLCSYQGGRTSEAFLGYLHEKVAADKGFARIGSLDTLARDFLAAADKTGAAAALKTAAEKLDEASRSAGLLYSKFAEKAATKVCINGLPRVQ